MSENMLFTAIIEDAGNGGAFVRIPCDVEQFYGQRYVDIRVRIDGKASHRTLVRRGEREYILPVLKDVRQRIGKGIGDEVEVELEDYSEPRLLMVPTELPALFEQNPQAASFFASLSYLQRKKYITWIISAEQEATRQERLLKAIEMLTQGKKAR